MSNSGKYQKTVSGFINLVLSSTVPPTELFADLVSEPRLPGSTPDEVKAWHDNRLSRSDTGCDVLDNLLVHSWGSPDAQGSSAIGDIFAVLLCLKLEDLSKALDLLSGVFKGIGSSGISDQVLSIEVLGLDGSVLFSIKEFLNCCDCNCDCCGRLRLEEVRLPGCPCKGLGIPLRLRLKLLV